MSRVLRKGTLKKCKRPACEVRFAPRRSETKYCSRPCATWAKGQNQQGRQNPRRAERFTKDQGPPITEGLDLLPRCTCGRRMDVGTDRIGRTILECAVCGPQLVTIIGTHVYDQRDRHQAELEQLITRGKTQIRNRPEHCGDAFRQRTHKKGIAAFLKGAA